MVAKQLSIFLENKSGRLTEVTEVLAKENINLSALCIAENADFGILRGIVSDPDKAYKALKDNHFAVNITDVVGISCPNVPGALAKVLGFLSAEGVFIEYTPSDLVIRPRRPPKVLGLQACVSPPVWEGDCSCSGKGWCETGSHGIYHECTL